MTFVVSLTSVATAAAFAFGLPQLKVLEAVTTVCVPVNPPAKAWVGRMIFTCVWPVVVPLLVLPVGIMPISANDSGCQMTTGTLTLVNFVLKLFEVAVDEITTTVLPVASALTDDLASFTVTT